MVLVLIQLVGLGFLLWGAWLCFTQSQSGLRDKRKAEPAAERPVGELAKMA